MHGDLLLRSSEGEVRVRASGEVLEVAAPGRRVLRGLVGSGSPRGMLARILPALHRADLGLVVVLGGRAVARFEPAGSGNLWGRLLGHRGLLLHPIRWLRSR